MTADTSGEEAHESNCLPSYHMMSRYHYSDWATPGLPRYHSLISYTNKSLSFPVSRPTLCSCC